MSRTVRILIPLFISFFLLALYVWTMPRGLTWAFDGADGGDLVTAAATGGVPHPTGYPTYLLAASAFLRLPIGSLAYRTNLLSAASTALAGLFVYLLVRSLDYDVLTAAVASLAFGTFPLVWSQAIITEVYGLNALFTVLLLYLGARGFSGRSMALVEGLVAGMALGNHLSIAFMLPVLFIAKRVPCTQTKNGAKEDRSIRAGWQPILARMAGLLLGLLIYLEIPLRAATQAPVNWGDAVNLDRFLWLVSGRAYWGRLEDLDAGYLWTGLQAWSHMMLQQVGVIGLLLVGIVIAMSFRRSWLYLVLSWMILAYSALAILFYSPDSYVYLIPALLALSVWMAFGAGWIVNQVTVKSPRFTPFVIVAILLYVVGRAVLAIPEMNLSPDTTAEEYAQTILTKAPARSIIFVRGDEATFALWYFHYAYHERPDVAVISSDLLFQPWYRDVLAKTYPDLIVSTQALQLDIVRENSNHPACVLESTLQTALECSP